MRVSFHVLFLVLTVLNFSTSQPSWSMDVEDVVKDVVCNHYSYSAKPNGMFEVRNSTPQKPDEGALKGVVSTESSIDLSGSAQAGITIGEIVFAGTTEVIRDKLWSAVLDARQNRQPEQIGQMAKHFELLGYVSDLHDMVESSVAFYTDLAFCSRDLAFEPKDLQPKTVIAYGRWAKEHNLSKKLQEKVGLLCSHYFVHRDTVGACFDEVLQEIPMGKKFDFMVDGLARLLGVLMDRIPPESVDTKHVCLDILGKLSRERQSLEAYFSLLERGYEDKAALSKEDSKKLNDAIGKDRRYQHTIGTNPVEESNILAAYQKVAPRVQEYLGGAQVTDEELVKMLYAMNKVRDLTIKKLELNPSDDKLIQMNSIATRNFKALMGYIANVDPGGYGRFTMVMSKMIEMDKGSSQELSHGG